MMKNKYVKRSFSLISYLLLMVAMVIGFVAFYMGISFLQEKLFIKGEYFTCVTKYPYSYLFFVVFAIGVSKVISVFFRKEKTYSTNRSLSLWIKFEKALVLAVIPLIYIILTSVVVVTEDGIYDYMFYNLQGNEYSFADVEYVDTGFVERGRNKGEFFYNVEFENGKKMRLAYPSTTQPSYKYDYDTWQEYVDIDDYIMKSGAIKSFSEDGSEYVQMDKVYVDRLLEVIRNK